MSALPRLVAGVPSTRYEAFSVPEEAGRGFPEDGFPELFL
jgi:hypothetical protein